METLAAAASQYPNGWGGPIALILPFLLYWAATTGYSRLKEARQGGPSPVEDPKPLETVKPQVTADSDSADSAPADGRGEVVPLRSKPIEEFIAERVDRQNPTQIVQEAIRRFKVSESTAWRLLKKVRDGGAA